MQLCTSCFVRSRWVCHVLCVFYIFWHFKGLVHPNHNIHLFTLTERIHMLILHKLTTQKLILIHLWTMVDLEGIKLINKLLMRPVLNSHQALSEPRPTSDLKNHFNTEVRTFLWMFWDVCLCTFLLPPRCNWNSSSVIFRSVHMFVFLCILFFAGTIKCLIHARSLMSCLSFKHVARK